MAVDKEALICLSRVYSYYFKCNFPLFYVYPALTRYLSILFLNILTLLACTHSSDNLFHTLMVLCENENFLTSNLLCFFTRVKLCPLVILLSLIWKKKVRINIFITIQYLKHFYLIPPQSSRFLLLSTFQFHVEARAWSWFWRSCFSVSSSLSRCTVLAACPLIPCCVHSCTNYCLRFFPVRNSHIQVYEPVHLNHLEVSPLHTRYFSTIKTIRSHHGQPCL